MVSGSRVLTETCSFDPIGGGPRPTKRNLPRPPLAPTWQSSGPASPGWRLYIWRGAAGRSRFSRLREPGYGASTRNAGYVGRTSAWIWGTGGESHGLPFATQIYSELMEAFLAVKETVEEQNIACHYNQQGRLLLATSSAMYEAMARKFALREKHLREPFAMVSRTEQAKEIGTERYFGGVKIEDHAGLHPGLYHQGLLDAARSVGVTIAAHTPVLRIGRDGAGFILQTPRARVAARDIIVATNGYSGDAFPWLKRRVMPLDAYQTVSEPMSAERVRQLLPGDRTFIDWNFNVDWIRRAPGDPTASYSAASPAGATRTFALWPNGCTCGSCGSFRSFPISVSTMFGPASAAELSTSIRISAAMRAFISLSVIVSPAFPWAPCSDKNWRGASSTEKVEKAPSTAPCLRTRCIGETRGSCPMPSIG